MDILLTEQTSCGPRNSRATAVEVALKLALAPTTFWSILQLESRPFPTQDNAILTQST
jgi:hypothetical protein